MSAPRVFLFTLFRHHRHRRRHRVPSVSLPDSADFRRVALPANPPFLPSASPLFPRCSVNWPTMIRWNRSLVMLRLSGITTRERRRNFEGVRTYSRAVALYAGVFISMTGEREGFESDLCQDIFRHLSEIITRRFDLARLITANDKRTDNAAEIAESMETRARLKTDPRS